MGSFFQNKHVQTVLGMVKPTKANVAYSWHRLELPDNDFLEYARTAFRSPKQALLLLGLTGTIDAHYAQHLMKVLVGAGYEVCVMHYRGMGKNINQLPRSIHSAETTDVNYLIRHIYEQHHPETLVGIGVSMGGNILLHTLVEQQNRPGLHRGIALAVPYELARASAAIPTVYQRFLLHSMRKHYYTKFDMGMELPFAREELGKIKTIRDFDHCVTATIFGFDSAEDYYAKATIRPQLKKIQTPTLLIHADDDPFIPLDTVPDHSELNANTQILRFENGGHAGFHETLLGEDYTYTQRLLDFLKSK